MTVKLYLKTGAKTYELYYFSLERGELIISDGVESLPFNEWLTEKFTDYVKGLPFTNELSLNRFKIKTYKLLKMFDETGNITKHVEKELTLMEKRAEIFNRRELARERRGK